MCSKWSYTDHTTHIDKESIDLKFGCRLALRCSKTTILNREEGNSLAGNLQCKSKQKQWWLGWKQERFELNQQESQYKNFRQDELPSCCGQSGLSAMWLRKMQLQCYHFQLRFDHWDWQKMDNREQAQKWCLKKEKQRKIIHTFTNRSNQETAKKARDKSEGTTKRKSARQLITQWNRKAKRRQRENGAWRSCWPEQTKLALQDVSTGGAVRHWWVTG